MTEREELELIDAARANAPAFITIRNDGEGKLKCFKCDGKIPWDAPPTLAFFCNDKPFNSMLGGVFHPTCLPDGWLAGAKNFGAL